MHLFGFNISRRAFDEPKKKKPRSVELGETGTSVYDGIISEEYNTKLIGTQGIEVYDEMRRSDGTVRAALLATSLPIRRAKWFIQPGSEESQDIEIAEFVTKALFEAMTITWSDLLRQALLSLPFGVMVFEKVFDIRELDGKERIVWQKFAPRLPKSIHAWQMEDKGDGIQQMLKSGGIANIPMEKLCVFVNEKEGDNWWGTPVLRPAYKHWWMKVNIEKIDAMAIERQGLGVPFAKMGEGSNDDDRAKAKIVLENMRAHEKAYVLIPAGVEEMGFLDMGAKSARDALPSISYHNREIVKSVLAQFLELGSTDVGSRALSQDHSELFLKSLEAVADGITDVFNKYAIPQLVDFNFSNVKQYPKLAYTGISRVEVDKLATAYSTLIGTNAVQALDKDEQYFREVLGLPERLPDDEPREPREQPEDDDDMEDEKDKTGAPKRKKKDFAEMNEFKPWRKLTFAEEKVNFEGMERAFDRLKAKFEIVASEMLEAERERYMAALSKAVNDGDIDTVKALSFKIQNDYRKLIKDLAQEAFEVGKAGASKEMDVERPGNPRDFMRQLDIAADSMAERHVTDLVTSAKQGLVEGLNKGESKAATLGAVDAILARKIKELTGNTADIVMGGYINYGRRAVFDAYAGKIYALQRSEILDLRTCNYCLSIDGRIVEKDDAFSRNTIFHSNCRGIWVEILEAEEDKPKIGGIPQTLRDRFGDAVNDLMQPRTPIVKKKK